MPADARRQSFSPADDPITRQAQELLRAAREDEQFSAGAWAEGDSAGLRREGVVGTPSWAEDRPIGVESLFDLASVTKPIVGLAVLRLVEQGVLALDTRVGEVLGPWPEGPMAHADLRSLLTHTSGAPGPTPLWQEHREREALLGALAHLEFTEPGRWCYSSMGFIALGLVAEHASSLPLDRLVEREITAPLAMEDTGFGPVDPQRAVATEDCPWRGRRVRGEVHDENAAVLGGVAGHAGLFGTARDLGRLGAALLRGEVLGPAMDRVHCGADDGRPLGWWPRERCTYLGEGYSAAAFGHTGFTGTSLVIDPEADRWVVLLTNRVHPTREPRGFEAVREEFHRVIA